MKMTMPMVNMAHDKWYLNSGASSHISNQMTDFVEFTPLSARVRAGGKHYLRMEGIGTIKKELDTSRGPCMLTMYKVRYALELQCSLHYVRRRLSR